MGDAALPSIPYGTKLSSKTLPDYLDSVSGVREANAKGRPVLVYFYTRASKPKSAKAKPTPTRQATECKRLEDTFFKGKLLRESVALKFFVCIKVDVTRVTPKQNRIFNTLKAPVVVAKASDGSVAGILAGRINRSMFFALLSKALSRSGIKVASAIAKAKILLDQVLRLENQKKSVGSVLSSCERALSGVKSNRGQARIAKAKARHAKAKKDMQKLEQKLAAAYAKLEEILAPPKPVGEPARV